MAKEKAKGKTKIKAKNYFLHLGNGLYLNPTGKIVDKLPSDEPSKLGDLGFVIKFPDLIRDELVGQDLHKISKSLINSGVLSDIFGISPKAMAIIGASIDLLFSLTTVTGAVGAYVDLLKLLVGNTQGQKDKMSQLLEITSEIHDVLKANGREDVVNKVIDEWRSIKVGESALRSFLLDNSPGVVAFTNLDSSYGEVLGATVTLLTDGFQKFMKEASDYNSFPWYTDRSWLVGRQGANFPPSAEISKMTKAGWYWDYTPYIGAIISAVSLLMLYYKAKDPAFRTTGTYSYEILQIADSLEAFGKKMIEHITWTRDWTMDDYYFRPMANGWPVGAVDVCSGASIFNPAWMEGVQVSQQGSGAIGNTNNPAGVLWEPPIVFNMAESLKNARNRRENDWLVIFYASGAPKVLQLAETLREMGTVPDTSETVNTTIRRSARRKLIGSESRKTPQIPRCDALDFMASVYEVKRSVRVKGTTQAPKRHPEEPNYWPIPYGFFIETYPGSVPVGQPLSREKLKSGAQSVPLQAQIFDWEVEDDHVHFEVSPIIQDRLENMLHDNYVTVGNSRPDLQVTRHPWNMPLNRVPEVFEGLINDPDMPGTPRNGVIGSITLDYEFTRGASDFNVVFRNKPGQDNFAGVYFVIEEQSRLTDKDGNEKPGPMIKTRIDISMIGRELHLPKKYFEYIRMCEARTRAIISQIEFEARLKEKPIPRWDPVIMDTVADWAQQVLREQPDVLQDELLKEAQLLARSKSLESY